MTNLITAAVLFVSPNGSDTNSGTLAAPLRHIQSALDRVGYGDTVNVMPGLYRGQIYLDGRYWPTNGTIGSDSNRLTIRSYGTPPPIIQASELVKAWAPVNDATEWLTVSGEPFCSNCVFKTEWVVPSGETVGLVMEAENMPLRDSPFLVPHTFLYKCGWLYIWPERAPIDGIEVGGGNSAFEEFYGAPYRAEAVDYVTMEGLRFRYSGTGLGGSGVSLGRFCVMDNCEVSWMDFQGVSCWNCTITNSTILACGAKGLEAAWSNSVVAYSIIGGNNWRGFAEAGQAAGIKIITRRVTGDPAYSDISGTEITHSLFTTNCGDAIWSDTMIAAPGRSFIVASNTITYNSGGIFLEVTSRASVIGNEVLWNTNKGINLRWGSSNTVAFNTVIVSSNSPIGTVPFHMRGEGDTDLGIRNIGNQVVSNLFITAIPQAVISTGQDGPMPDSAYYGNTYAWNTFTNTAFPLQLNVWEYPYSGGPVGLHSVQDFEARANGGRVQFGNRPANPNTGNQ